MRPNILLLGYPTVPFFCIMLCSIFGDITFIDNFVYNIIMSSLASTNVVDQLPPIRMSDLLSLQGISWILWAIFLQSHRMVTFYFLDTNLPQFMKVPIYKATFLLLLLSLPMILALPLPGDEEEEEVDEEEEEEEEEGEEGEEEEEEEEEEEQNEH